MGAGIGGTLDERVVIVTGAGRGLGQAYAEAAAAAGARVVVNDVDASEAEETVARIASAGGEARASVGSVATWDGAAALVASAVDAYGALHGVVNNAGLFYRALPWDETEDGIRRIVDVNVLGPLYVATHAMRAMQDRGGSIVNITSEGAFGQMPDLGTYGATKGAVSSMTYAWALANRDRGIRVNAIAPRAQTRMSPTNPDGTPKPRPAPSAGTPLAIYLLSELSAAVTGQILHFNGSTLSLVNQAGIADGGVERDTWTAEDIATAVDGGIVPRG